VWYVIKPKVGGLAFLRALLRWNKPREVYVRQVAHRTSIYAVNVDKDLWFLPPHEVILRAGNLELGEGWERVEVFGKTIRHRGTGWERKVLFVRLGGREHPLYPPRSLRFFEDVEGSGGSSR